MAPDLDNIGGLDLGEIDRIYEETVNDAIETLNEDDQAAEDEDTDEELERVLAKHTQSDIQQKVAARATRTLVTSAIDGRSEAEVRQLIDQQVVIGDTLSQTAAWVLKRGATIVRDDWGDGQTEEAVMEYLRVAAPQTADIPDEDLRDWVRLQLDWARLNVLGTPPLKYGDMLVAQRTRRLQQAREWARRRGGR